MAVGGLRGGWYGWWAAVGAGRGAGGEGRVAGGAVWAVGGRWPAFVMRLEARKIENLHLAHLFVEEICVGNAKCVTNDN